MRKAKHTLTYMASYTPHLRGIRNRSRGIDKPFHPRFRNLHPLRYVASRLLPKRPSNPTDAPLPLLVISVCKSTTYLRGSISSASTHCLTLSLPPSASLWLSFTSFAVVRRRLPPLLSVYYSYIFPTLAYPSKLISYTILT